MAICFFWLTCGMIDKAAIKFDDNQILKQKERECIVEEANKLIPDKGTYCYHKIRMENEK